MPPRPGRACPVSAWALRVNPLRLILTYDGRPRPPYRLVDLAEDRRGPARPRSAPAVGVRRRHTPYTPDGV